MVQIRKVQRAAMLERLKTGVRLHLYVQPNGKKSEVLGEHGGALKIRIQAPPVEGKANDAVEKFVATLFGVPRGRVKLVRGEQSRTKVVEVSELDWAAAEHVLAEALLTVKNVKAR
jgi:uncharacterized protein (TIGR00251 family)